MTNDNLLQQLTQLGSNWTPDARFVEGVMARLDDAPRLSTAKRRPTTRLIRLSLGVAAALLAGLGFWWASGLHSTANPLYAQVMRAMERVQSFHAVVYVQTEVGKSIPASETWFARNQGYIVTNTQQTRIDNGSYFWEFTKGSDKASRDKSQGADNLLDEALDIREILQRDCQRHPTGDRVIDGATHQCYRLTFHGPAQPADPSFLAFDKRRTFLFVTSESLLKRVEFQEKISGEWRNRVIQTWEYDVPVDPKLFEPSFGAEVQVIDTEKAFEQLTTIEDALHSELRDGLIYTIHQAKRFENGGVFLRTSVRGSEETLAKYPLTRRLVQPGLYFTEGPAKNVHASPQGMDSYRLKLATANQQGIHVEWWMLVPRGRKPDWFENKHGQVQLKLGITPEGEYAKENHADARGVIHHISWNLALDIPKPETLPTLSEIARAVHGELQMLSPMAFPQLDMGAQMVNGVLHGQVSSVDKVSATQFATATQAHWLLWEQRDIDFQLSQGGISQGGNRAMMPAVALDYHSAVDDATLSALAKRQDLVLISVRGTNITDEGLKRLSGLRKLSRLNLSDTAISDTGLRHLEGITSLKKLDLKGTRVTQAGIAQLQRALPRAEVKFDNPKR
jgi:hypothetical protein